MRGQVERARENKSHEHARGKFYSLASKKKIVSFFFFFFNKLLGQGLTQGLKLPVLQARGRSSDPQYYHTHVGAILEVLLRHP